MMPCAFSNPAGFRTAPTDPDTLDRKWMGFQPSWCEAPLYIATVVGRGYRFIAAVHAAA